MSKQIRIIQSSEDDSELNSLLLEEQPLIALPKIFTNFEADFKRLGDLKADKQVLFLEQEISYIQERIVPCLGKDGMFLIGDEWLYIEWTKTKCDRLQEYGVKGRYYYRQEIRDSETYSSTADQNFDIVAKMNSLFESLSKKIKKTYKKTFIGKAPIYIGPHLNEQLSRGEACIILPNGERLNI